MAGERWVASTGLFDKERSEEEDWAERPGEFADVGLAGVSEGLLCGNREDSSVSGSSNASSSSAGVDLLTAAPENI